MSSSEVHKPLAASALRLTRERQARQFSVRAFVVVGLPTLSVLLYLGLIASRQYESVTELAVDAANTASLLGPLPGSAVPRDTMMAQECLTSHDAFAELVDHHDYLAHYKRASVDRLSRLSAHAPHEKAYRYFRKHTDATYDPATTFVTLRVRAFDGGAARRYADALVRFCDARMRAVSTASRQGRVGMADAEVSAARTRVAAEQTAIREAGADPQRLEYATKAKDIALTAWVHAAERAEVARAEVLREDRYIVRVTEPSRPDASSHPEVFRSVFAVFLASAALLVIGSILISAAREHAEV